MTFILKPVTCLVTLLCLFSGMVSGQDSRPRFGLNIGTAAWLNQCDVPAAQQSSTLEPSFGPFLSLYYGKFVLGFTFFNGTFNFEPQDGIIRLGEADYAFSNPTARQKQFTTGGHTNRTDIDISLRYAFRRTLQLSFGLTASRRSADLTAYRGPRPLDGGGIILPTDEQNVAEIAYTTTQFWVSEGLHGSFGVETISSRFSVFYSATVLMIFGERGSGKVDSYLGLDKNFGTGRVVYTVIRDDETGQEGLVFRNLSNRKIGTNAGMAFSTGLGFEISDKPSLVLFGGYNFKFYSETETDLIDHSSFHGPYMGLSWNVF